MKAIVEHKISLMPAAQYIAGYHNPDKVEPFCRACPNYGRCWTCPPFIHDEPMRIKQYEWVLVLGAKITPDQELRNSPDSAAERNALAHRLITQTWLQNVEPLMRSLENAHADSMLLCGFFACPAQCAKHCARIDGKPCRHPQLMRPSLEAYGFDVALTTSQLLELELLWGTDNALPRYTTLVTALFTHDQPAIEAAKPSELSF